MDKYNNKMFQRTLFFILEKYNKEKNADLNFISFSLVCPCECAVWKSKRAQLNVFQ